MARAPTVKCAIAQSAAFQELLNSFRRWDNRKSRMGLATSSARKSCDAQEQKIDAHGRRPRAILNGARIAALRAQGFGWKRIANDLGVGVGTIYRFAADGSKVQEKVF
jgi:DNA invertase Pin-like site-specific DNA recombinase